MRGSDQIQSSMFSYLSPETRVRKEHPLRPIRVMVDEALRRMSPLFEQMYSEMGRPSIAPEKLLRAQLLQMLYSVRSERLLMEEIDYSVLFRWFVGMSMDEPVWDATVFTKNRDRLLDAEGAKVSALTPLIQGGSRMRKSARTVLCGGCRAIGIPTATANSSLSLSGKRSHHASLPCVGQVMIRRNNRDLMLTWSRSKS